MLAVLYIGSFKIKTPITVTSACVSFPMGLSWWMALAK